MPGLLLSFLLVVCLMGAAASAVEFHGSGTTHTARCFYSVFEEFQARSKSPVQMTYRSVGSSTGLTEFKNNFDPQEPAVDFAAGEIPVTMEDYQTFTDMNVTILHLPTLFGAVSFFHSIPDTPNLNLTSCLLARIFTRDIKDWTHPDILAFNAGLSHSFEASTTKGDSLGASLPIRVARRSLGSSAALSITEYLHKACPRYFPETMVGSLPDWPIDTESCKGTLGMIDCIKSRAGTIGFMDTGSGVSANLPEISIRNKFGRLLTAQEAIAHQGVGAIEQGVLPEDPTADFSSVSLLDQDGEWTWPITLLTYIYIRQDLSFMADPDSQSLLVAFLKALYDPDYVTQCNTKHGLTLASGASLKLGLDGVKLLEASLPSAAHAWTFEGTAQAIVGTGDYVISSNRNNYPKMEREMLLADLEMLSISMAELETQVANLQAQLAETSQNSRSGGEIEFEEKHEAQIMASLVIGSAAFAAVLLALVIYCVHGRADDEDVKQPEASPGI